MSRAALVRLAVLAMTVTACADGAATPAIRVGSLRDVEGTVLGELFSQTIERTGEARVERRFGLGGTGIVFAALDAGEVDLVPQYSGSLAETVLHRPGLSDFDAIRADARARGYEVGPALGFNNTYGIGMRRSVAEQHGLARISDLRGKPWKGGVTTEFANTPSGLQRLIAVYGVTLGPVRIMEHALSYVALQSGDVDFVDVYTTDAAIASQDLVVLDDDQGVFVRYEGLPLARAGFAARFPRSWAALEALGGRLSDRTMSELNRQFDIERRQPGEIIASFLGPPSGAAAPRPVANASGWRRWGNLTLEHCFLVAVSLAAALLVGVPLGIWAADRPAIAKAVLSVAGIVQTIPSVALLCFFIPALGIGWKPAVYALALYALLPVVQGAITGLQHVDPRLREVALVLGMSRWEQRRRVELPLAAPALVAGVRVAAVTNVGTAALAALVGAGGYGTLIVQGLALNDWRIVLEGALPSAALAMLLHGVFTALESRLAVAIGRHSL